MGISSLGVGSKILTQDLLDQLRKADEAARLTPVKLSIANEKDKQSTFDVVSATMKNLTDAIGELKTATLFDERSATVTGTSVEVSADANSDLQSFTLDVQNLATKQIEESGSFTAKTDTIAKAGTTGTISMSVGADSFTLNYDDTTTLEDLKNQINNVAGNSVNATVVQVGATDFRLFLTSARTGAAEDITLKDNSANLKDTRIAQDAGGNGGTTVVGSPAVDANFTFNGQAVTRASNNVTDLITGYNITLKEVGSSTVSVEQNRDNIMKRVDSFVEKYNAAIDELKSVTKSSTDSSTRGIFSGESTMKNLLSTLQDMVGLAGEGVATMYDFGFDVDRDGKMSVDKTVLNQKLDDNPANVEAFFSGGDYVKANGTTVTLTGVFNEMGNSVDAYTKTTGMLNELSDGISAKITSLEDQQQSVIDQLDSKYEIMKKKFTAYDLMISKLNSASQTFIQMANAQINGSKQ